MGVVYKLTPEISAFIIEHKQSNPATTCQALSDIVLAKFDQHVSKSSVHELLKQAHVITPRVRKVKEKFQIPTHKKQQISKALAPFVAIGSSTPPNISLVQTVPTKVAPPEIIEEIIPEEQPTQQPKEYISGKGDIFIQSALFDLSNKPIVGISDFNQMDSVDQNKIKMEWEYLTQLVYAIKIELESGYVFFIDPRFQGIYDYNPNTPTLAAPIERAAYEVADYILNNIKPIIIRKFDASCSNDLTYDIFSAFQNISLKKIIKIALIGAKDEQIVEFNHPLGIQRNFIIAVDSQNTQYQWFMNNSAVETTWNLPMKDNSTSPTVRLLKKSNKIIITNLESMTYAESVKMYEERHPGESLQLSVIENQKSEQSTDFIVWFKNKLQQRALMFFPQSFSRQALEDATRLEGYEQKIVDKKKNLIEIKVHLRVSSNHPQIQQFQRAAENINSLNISDFQGMKRTVKLDISSE